MLTPQLNVTEMLNHWGNGDREVLDKLIPIVYKELRRQAGHYLRREGPGNTLQTTGLVHETYLKLVDQRRVQWQNRAHFFGLAAQLMRRILIDHIRKRKAAKRGGLDLKLPLEEAMAVSTEREIDLLTLDEALTRLAKIDEQQSRIVELRFFSGLSVEDTAGVLGISERTVKRDWQVAKAWLRREISKR